MVTRWEGSRGGGGGGGGGGHAGGERRPRGNRGVGEARSTSSRGVAASCSLCNDATVSPLVQRGGRWFSVAPENRRKVQSGTPVVNESTEQSEKPSIK